MPWDTKSLLLPSTETVRDDVTFEEALAIFQQNEVFQEYLAAGKLQILSSGSWILGTDLDQIDSQPSFRKTWGDARAYIAKGAGNALSLLGQKRSLEGLHIRMMKNVSTAYDLIGRIRGISFAPRSPYEMAFTYQHRAPEFPTVGLPEFAEMSRIYLSSIPATAFEQLSPNPPIDASL